MIQQLLYYLNSVIALPFIPFLSYLGKRVERDIPKLPEASENITGKIRGNQEAINLLTIGESTIAGVGVTDHKDGITGQIAMFLHEKTKKTVNWQVVAKNGYTAQRVQEHLVKLIPQINFDMIVIGLGANDTFQFNSPLTFKKHIFALITKLKQSQPQAKIVIISVPPVSDFPAFPKLLKFFLGNLVQLHGNIIKDISTFFPSVFYMPKILRLKDWLNFENRKLTPQDLFSDGIHPSALTYSIWGKEVVNFMLKNEIILHRDA
jgi:lysophospholipase L1-like esterase